MWSGRKCERDRGAKGLGWDLVMMGSAGGRPKGRTCRESREDGAKEASMERAPEAAESEYYYKRDGKRLKGFKWGRHDVNYIRRRVKNRLNRSKSGKGGTVHGRNGTMPRGSQPPLLLSHETSGFIQGSSGPSQKSLFPIFLAARHQRT